MAKRRNDTDWDERNENLFINTLKDLKNKLASADDYEILGISGLLRKLLIDGNPLAHQVNRQYKQKLEFEIGVDNNFDDFEKGKMSSLEFYSVQDGFDPKTSRPGKISRKVNLDAMLRTPLMLVNGRTYTVRDIILFEANIMGGVHAGTPKSEQEEVIAKIAKEISLGGYRSSLRQLKAIGRVVLMGLSPLVDQINMS